MIMTRTLRNSLFAGFAVALAFATGATAQGYAKYRVLDTAVIQDMWAGPAHTAALLAPDGSRLLHLGRGDRDMCLYAPAQIGSWVELACAEYTDDNRPGEAQDMFGAPAGDELLMPSQQDALQAFRDTDIRVFDAATFTVRNLTDDGFEGSFLKNRGPAELDMLAQWGGDGSIFFVRYSIPAGGYTQGASTSLMRIAADGGQPQKLLDITSTGNAPVWNFTVSSDATLMAYSIDNPKADNAGIYLLEVGATEPNRVAELTALDGMRVSGLAFSADRKFLLLLGRKEDDGYNTARVLDLASGEVIPVDAHQNVTGVAWSPTGSALAYVTYDRTKPEMPGGLFLAPEPGKPARLLIGGGFYPPVCCGDRPFIWASNDTMVLSQMNKNLGTVLYVQLGE
jgi:hypothetical protein